MWGEFVVVAFVQLAFLVMPGYFLLRAVGCARLKSIVLSPVVSSAFVFVLCIIYSRIGVASSWFSVVVPLVALAIALFLIATAIMHRRSGVVSGDSRNRWFSLTGYALLGIAMGVFVFLTAIDDPNNFVQRFDSYMHVSVVRGFIESGNMTVFGISPYITDADQAISPHTSGGFYPAGWYILAALSLTLVPTTVVIAENALLFVFVCVVFPMGMYLLMEKVGDGSAKFCFYGAIASMAFIAFPWNLIEFGPIYPNAAGLCLFPHVAVTFIDMLDASNRTWQRIVSLACLVIGVLSCAIIQTNVVFVLIIFLLPFAVTKLYRLGIADGVDVASSGKAKRNLVLCIGFVLLVCLMWCVLYATPMFQNMKAWGWLATMSRTQAFANILVLKTPDAPPQVFLAIVVVVGFAYLLRGKKQRWLLVSYAVMAFMTFLGDSVDNVIKFVLDTFCYSDPRRLWAFLALFGMPIAAYGLVAIDDAVRKLLRVDGTYCAGAKQALAVSALVTVAFCVCNFSPQNALLGQSKPYNDPFDTVREMIDSAAIGDEVALTIEERAFVGKVLEELPEGTLVANLPTDGTLFAYGSEGVRTYFRFPSSYQPPGETDEATVIRLHLDEVASNAEVREALGELGIEYLMLLDVGNDADSNWRIYGDDPEVWLGIVDIDDDTPGFEVVLSEGDMRLYRIVA